MIAIDLSTLKPPPNWQKRVHKAVPNIDTFQREVRRFERLGINDTIRRKGFRAFAPDALPKNRRKEAHFKAIWGAAKESLGKLSHFKCAYCESPINARRSGQVEHFKPKSLFPSLAYDWRNYLLGCGGCNGAKGDKWPKRGGYIRPDKNKPSGKFRFEPDGTVSAVTKGSAADRMVSDFDFNGRWLVQRRRIALKSALDELKDLIEEAGCTSEIISKLAAKQLKRLSSPEVAYSAAITQCFVRAWNSACPESTL